ncbi:hypothetical protein [Rhodoplanes sp. Z2-YC6860]|uniref:hypothetical protein n=1 Tax=Rhodoplanes sp. Z2-YC6860 TaxID=674703 RepID=UPI000836AD7C|nr:hypothetical protein [Rhodoplanes sp. Z2-YC6860]
MQNVFWETLRMVELKAAALTFAHMKWRTEMRLIQSETAKTIAGSRDLMRRVDALLTKEVALYVAATQPSNF